jgi:hypothetical protein
VSEDEAGRAVEASRARRLRRAAGWPALVATGAPRWARLHARAAAARHALLEAVALRWVAGGASAEQWRTRLPLALLRLVYPARASAEPPLSERPAAAGEVPAAVQATRGVPPAQPASVEPPRGVAEHLPAPSVSAASGPAPAPAGAGSVAARPLRRLAGSPASGRPLAATTRRERLAPALARVTGPPTYGDTSRTAVSERLSLGHGPGGRVRSAVVGAREAPREGTSLAIARTPAGAASDGVARPNRPEGAVAGPSWMEGAAELAAPAAPRTAPIGDVAELRRPPLPRVTAGPAQASRRHAAAAGAPPTPARASAVLAAGEIAPLRPSQRTARGAANGEPLPLPLAPRAAPPAQRDRAPDGVAAVARPPALHPSIAAAPRARSTVAPPPSSWPAEVLPLARPTAAPAPAARETQPAGAPVLPPARTADAAPFGNVQSTSSRPEALEPPAREDPRAARIRTNRLADQVYDLIVRRLDAERSRRGF